MEVVISDSAIEDRVPEAEAVLLDGFDVVRLGELEQQVRVVTGERDAGIDGLDGVPQVVGLIAGGATQALVV